MTTSTKVQMPSTNKTMSTYRQRRLKGKGAGGGEGGVGHGFTHVQHETLRLSQWKQMYLEPHHGKHSIPHHGNKEKGGSLQHLKVGHRDNGSP